MAATSLAASLSVAFLLLLALQPGDVRPSVVENATSLESEPTTDHLLMLAPQGNAGKRPSRKKTVKCRALIALRVFLLSPLLVFHFAGGEAASASVDGAAGDQDWPLGPDINRVALNIDRQLLERCLQEARTAFKERTRLEETLYETFQATLKGTPTFYHQKATPQTVEAQYMVEGAVLAEESLKCLRRNGVAELERLPAWAVDFLKGHWPQCRSHDWPYWASAELHCRRYENQQRYRSLDGSCNNLRNALWGTAFRPYRRILPSEYDDGFSTPRNASVHHTAGELPPGRQVSQCMQNATDQWTEPRLSMLFLEFGQFLGQDMTATAASRGARHLSACGSTQHDLTITDLV